MVTIHWLNCSNVWGPFNVFFCSAGVPEVKIDPPTLTTQEGGNLTFTCLVTGVPTPTIRWRTEHLQSSWTLQVHDTAFTLY